MPDQPKTGPAEAKIVVWFDHPRDCLCFSTRAGLEPGEEIPPDRIVRIPLRLGEDFIEAVMNAATSAAIMGGGTKDYDSVMSGVQTLLDQRMVAAIDLAEEFRKERGKAAGGGVINRANGMVAVPVSEFARLERLREAVRRAYGSYNPTCEYVDPKHPFERLHIFLQENGFYES